MRNLLCPDTMGNDNILLLCIRLLCYYTNKNDGNTHMARYVKGKRLPEDGTKLAGQ